MFLLLACPDGGPTEGSDNHENHVMKRTSVSAVIATVYIFSYVNIQERQQRSYNMVRVFSFLQDTLNLLQFVSKSNFVDNLLRGDDT